MTMEYTPCEDPECYDFWPSDQDEYFPELERATERYERDVISQAEQY